MLIYVSAFLNIISKQLTIRILDQIQFANYVINSLRISSDATSESSLWNDFILLPFVLEISEFSKHVFFNSCHYGHNRKLRHSSWFSGVDSLAGNMSQMQRQRQTLTTSRGRQRKLTDSETGNSGSLSNKSTIKGIRTNVQKVLCCTILVQACHTIVPWIGKHRHEDQEL